VNAIEAIVSGWIPASVGITERSDVCAHDKNTAHHIEHVCRLTAASRPLIQ
jgi:hypothetical protein